MAPPNWTLKTSTFRTPNLTPKGRLVKKSPFLGPPKMVEFCFSFWGYFVIFQSAISNDGYAIKLVPPHWSGIRHSRGPPMIDWNVCSRHSKGDREWEWHLSVSAATTCASRYRSGMGSTIWWNMLRTDLKMRSWWSRIIQRHPNPCLKFLNFRLKAHPPTAPVVAPWQVFSVCVCFLGSAGI